VEKKYIFFESGKSLLITFFVTILLAVLLFIIFLWFNLSWFFLIPIALILALVAGFISYKIEKKSN
jgi:4-hydroxybenzoate polyprenyltransferase